jgi:hypothetical protein
MGKETWSGSPNFLEGDTNLSVPMHVFFEQHTAQHREREREGERGREREREREFILIREEGLGLGDGKSLHHPEKTRDTTSPYSI